MHSAVLLMPTIYHTITLLNGCIVSDINECEDSSPCHQICNNTSGSFICDCVPGFKLAGDGQTCEGIKHFVKVSVKQLIDKLRLYMQC